MVTASGQQDFHAHDVGVSRTHRREAAEWAEVLGELATVLGNGQFYGRDLPVIDAPLGQVVDRYMRRMSERRH